MLEVDKSINYFIYFVSLPKQCHWQVKLHDHSHTQGFLQSYLSFTSCPFPLPSSESVLHIHTMFVTSHVLLLLASHITLQMWYSCDWQLRYSSLTPCHNLILETSAKLMTDGLLLFPLVNAPLTRTGFEHRNQYCLKLENFPKIMSLEFDTAKMCSN